MTRLGVLESLLRGISESGVMWLDWTHDGQELVTLNADAKMTRWSWATTSPIDAISLSATEPSGHAQAAPNGASYEGNDCGQAIAIKNQHAAPVEVHDSDIERLVIDPRKSLLACVIDDALAVWDISTPTPMPIAATTLPDDVWARSCAFAGTSGLVFGTFGVGYRTYDYLRDEWRVGDTAPTNGSSALSEQTELCGELSASKDSRCMSRAADRHADCVSAYK